MNDMMQYWQQEWDAHRQDFNKWQEKWNSDSASYTQVKRAKYYDWDSTKALYREKDLKELESDLPGDYYLVKRRSGKTPLFITIPKEATIYHLHTHPTIIGKSIHDDYPSNEDLNTNNKFSDGIGVILASYPPDNTIGTSQNRRDYINKIRFYCFSENRNDDFHIDFGIFRAKVHTINHRIGRK